MGYKVHSVNGQMGEVQLPVGGSVAWEDVEDKPDSFPPSSHTHPAAQISDATAVGRGVLTAADAAAARAAIGAGTSSLTIGTTGSTAAAGNHTHTAAQISDASSVGRSVVTAADAAAARTAIGAGTSSLTLGTGASQAAAGNHTHPGLMSGSAPAVADSEAADVAALVADFNTLLSALRTRGVIS